MAGDEPRRGSKQVICPNCGQRIDQDDRFCAFCGAATRLGTLEPRHETLAARPSAEYMGFWIRLLAWVIDAILMVAVGGILARFTGLPGIGTVVSVVYYVVLTGLLGQTLGKMALGIQVVDVRGNTPGLLRAVLREIVGKFISGIALLLGYLWIGLDSRKRGWHDYIGGTYVVRKVRPAI